MGFLEKRNNALRANPFVQNGQSVAIHITTRGSDWYWTVCAIMAFSTLAFVGMSTRVPRQNRIFHYITAAITLVASIAYFSMGANLGWTSTAVEWHRSNHRVAGNTRQVFYVRYIDWFVTTPLLLLDLLLTAAIPWPTILYVILLDWIMIITGLVGALVTSSYKWGYFTFGCAALVYVIYVLVFEARRNASSLGNDVSRVYLMCGAVTSFVWVLYPIAWGVCEGGNVISPDSEAVFYGILDIIAKPVFGALLIFGHRGIDPARLGLVLRETTGSTRGTGGAIAEEKHHGAGVTDGHTTTTATNGHSATPATTTAV